MARLARLSLPGVTQHIIQRGNNRQICFVSTSDFAAYAAWLAEYSDQYQVNVHAWVFMTNHVHLLLTPETTDGISRMMQMIGRQYVRYFNRKYRRSGTLWEGRFKSCVIDAECYLLICQRYIELNPVRAGMVSAPGEYHWSSFQANGLGKKVSFWTPHETYLAIARQDTDRQAAYRDLFKGAVDDADLTMIRKATNKGMAVGSAKFRQQIEQLSGRRVTEMRPGPRIKAAR